MVDVHFEKIMPIFLQVVLKGIVLVIIWILILVPVKQVLAADFDSSNDPFEQLDNNSNLFVSTPATTKHKSIFYQLAQNFLWRQELGLQFGSRIVGFAGFEIQQRFSSAYATVAAFNYQGALYWQRDLSGHLGQSEMAAMPMGKSPGEYFLTYQTHNAYLDVYNPLGGAGDFNLRMGRFYLPFGLNAQTDTHATFLQLSNQQHLGFNQDLMVGGYGALNDNFDYHLGYFRGAGNHSASKRQQGLWVGRITLSNQWLYNDNLEAGSSFLWGERLDPLRANDVIKTWRYGIDGRQKWPFSSGVLTLTSEISFGADDSHPIGMALFQGSWLTATRRWGIDSAYREYFKDYHTQENLWVYNLNYYFDNDISRSKLMWIGLGIERPETKTSHDSSRITIVTVYFYKYW